MSDATRRGLRTGLQLVVTLLTNGALFGLLLALDVPVTVEQFGAVSAVLLPAVTAALNALEDRGSIPAVWKAPASDGEHPVPEDATAEGCPGAAADLGESLSQGHEGWNAGPDYPDESGSRRLQ